MQYFDSPMRCSRDFQCRFVTPSVASASSLYRCYALPGRVLTSSAIEMWFRETWSPLALRFSWKTSNRTTATEWLCARGLGSQTGSSSFRAQKNPPLANINRRWRWGWSTDAKRLRSDRCCVVLRFSLFSFKVSGLVALLQSL